MAASTPCSSGPSIRTSASTTAISTTSCTTCPADCPACGRWRPIFIAATLRVLFPVMPWDVGTRPEGVPLWAAAARDMKAIGADGINGDTMGGIGREFRKASDDCGHPLVLEPENGLSDDGMVAWNNMSWGYWQYQPVPVVSKYKWIEPRHMVNVCERWAKDRTRRPTIGFLQRRGLRKLGERVGDLERAHAARRGGHSAHRHDRAGRTRVAHAARTGSRTFPPCRPLPACMPAASPATGQTLWLLVNRSGSDSTGPQLKMLRGCRHAFL